MPEPFFVRLLRRFVKYSLAGGATFAFDLLLLWTLTILTAFPATFLIAISFLVAVSINYFICYFFVYRGTGRTRGRGYVYFLLIGIAAAVVIALGTEFITLQFAIPLLFARILIGGVVGIANFLMNTFWNFKLV